MIMTNGVRRSIDCMHTDNRERPEPAFSVINLEWLSVLTRWNSSAY